jgi:hypothetical protein
MPTSGQIYNQIQDVMNQYNGMTPVNSGDVYGDLVRRVDSFRPQYEEMRGAENQAYSAPGNLMKGYFDTYGMDPAAGPSAMTRLQSILGDVNQKFSNADVYGDVIKAQQGRLGDLAGTVLNQYNAQRDALQNKYQMLSPLYQAALQKEEARRAAAAQAAAYRNLYGNGNPTAGDPNAIKIDTAPSTMDRLKRAGQAIGGVGELGQQLGSMLGNYIGGVNLGQAGANRGSNAGVGFGMGARAGAGYRR